VPNLDVTFDDMETAAKQLRDGQEEIEGKLGDLKAKVDDLVNSGYVTDRSSKAFDESYTEFNTGVTNVVEGLDGMATYLDEAANALRETDEELAKALQG
jgi:WXG100 family type VII secretion target